MVGFQRADVIIEGQVSSWFLLAVLSVFKQSVGSLSEIISSIIVNQI